MEIFIYLIDLIVAASYPSLQKPSPTGSENTIGGGTGMLKSGRRRWGQSKPRESREELDPSDKSVSNSKKEERSLKEDHPLYML